MKSCPTCQRTFDDQTLSYCLDDGTPLVEIYDSQATLVNAPYRADTDPTRAATDPVRLAPEPTLVVSPSYGGYQPPPTETKSSGRGKWILVAIGIPVALGVIVVISAAIGVIWLSQGSENSNRPVANRNTSEPTETPEIRETPESSPTPSELASVSGIWKGNWTNSKGESGTTTITIEEAEDGTITGNEGEAYVMVGGRRSGNTLTWSFIGGTDSCYDYACTFEVDSTATHGHGTYEVTDTCNDTTFSGTYVDYRKQ
jgi:hypothetical protein